MRILSFGLFFLTFFLLYGGLHVYFFRKLKRAFHPEGTRKILVVAALVLLFLASPIIRVTERVGLEAVAKFFSWGGYGWMGFLFLFFAASLLLDLWALLLRTAGKIGKRDLSSAVPAPPWAFAGPLLIAGVLSLYSFYEARHVVVERIAIRSSKIAEQVGRVRIAQISDVHIGLLIGKERMQVLIEEIRRESPDILVSTGDLVDGQLDGMEGVAEQFKAFQPRFGKYAITGNHEFYAGIEQAVDFTKSAGFTVLRGDGMTIAGVLNVVGVDDDTGRNFDNYRPANERELLAKLPRRYFTLLLKHKPFIDKEAVEFFDLQLSGHTHRGQIFPFSLVTRFFFPLHAGYFRFLNASHLYVSRGTGTWGPPMRLLSPPEVTIIDLLPAQRP
ncbi:MAG TPA: metallophosphoesterase [Syntrophales bacterium]|nr:metallophosphoesterase [Syntrophales bacterium]